MTAKAKGLTERRVLYGHVFRNAMLIVIAGFPAVFLGVFFGASLIIETIFSLDGLGRLGFEAAVARDYPVIFGTLFVFGLIGSGRRTSVGPDVCLDRSAHRLRDAGDLRRWRCATTARRPPGRRFPPHRG
jgi:ABC-type microcin C transport system permease subunit YejB